MGAVMFDPGRLSARLDLEMPQVTSDGQGGAVTVFTTVATLWALIEPVSVREEERADATVFSVTHAISIRFRDDLSAGMRFRKGNRVFAITAFHDPDGTQRYLTCRCREEGR
jgi:SPP1 family predicted phage head-tail adaptor